MSRQSANRIIRPYRYSISIEIINGSWRLYLRSLTLPPEGCMPDGLTNYPPQVIRASRRFTDQLLLYLSVSPFANNVLPSFPYLTLKSGYLSQVPILVLDWRLLQRTCQGHSHIVCMHKRTYIQNKKPLRQKDTPVIYKTVVKHILTKLIFSVNF